MAPGSLPACTRSVYSRCPHSTLFPTIVVDLQSLLRTCPLVGRLLSILLLYFVSGLTSSALDCHFLRRFRGPSDGSSWPLILPRTVPRAESNLSPPLLGVQLNVVWLAVVTYLHHHGYEEKIPWYRGQVCASLCAVGSQVETINVCSLLNWDS
jgi:hypothetical protein